MQGCCWQLFQKLLFPSKTDFSTTTKWFDCHEHYIDSGDDANDVDYVVAADDDDDDVDLVGGAPCGAVEARVPFSKHINVARAVFRAQDRCKKYFHIQLRSKLQYQSSPSSIQSPKPRQKVFKAHQCSPSSIQSPYRLHSVYVHFFPGPN